MWSGSLSSICGPCADAGTGWHPCSPSPSPRQKKQKKRVSQSQCGWLPFPCFELLWEIKEPEWWHTAIFKPTGSKFDFFPPIEFPLSSRLNMVRLGRLEPSRLSHSTQPDLEAICNLQPHACGAWFLGLALWITKATSKFSLCLLFLKKCRLQACKAPSFKLRPSSNAPRVPHHAAQPPSAWFDLLARNSKPTLHMGRSVTRTHLANITKPRDFLSAETASPPTDSTQGTYGLTLPLRHPHILSPPRLLLDTQHPHLHLHLPAAPARPQSHAAIADRAILRVVQTAPRAPLSSSYPPQRHQRPCL